MALSFSTISLDTASLGAVPLNTASLVTAAAVVVGLLVAGATYAIGRKNGKPRFVIALCLVAVAMAVAELVEMLGVFVSPDAVYGHVWLGMGLSGTSAHVAGLADVVIYLVGAVGLWALKPWARTGSMVYLLYLLVSFVIWGVRDTGGQGVVVIMAWQMFVLPFITFSLMYLQGGARYFGVRAGGEERKTGWLY